MGLQTPRTESGHGPPSESLSEGVKMKVPEANPPKRESKDQRPWNLNLRERERERESFIRNNLHEQLNFRNLNCHIYIYIHLLHTHTHTQAGTHGDV